jgi:hypothetical protein
MIGKAPKRSAAFLAALEAVEAATPQNVELLDQMLDDGDTAGSTVRVHLIRYPGADLPNGVVLEEEIVAPSRKH